MRLTRLFVERPTLVFVMLAIVVVVGAISILTIVQQQFPNVDFPTVNVRASYPGGSTTQIRDAVVRPIEDAIAGSPDLDHISTTVQEGQATIAATFTLSSNLTTDLVQVQRRVLIAQAQLPSDMPAPTVGSFDPAQTTVVTLGVSSRAMTSQALSAIVTNNIVPTLEQVDGVSNVNANGAVTPAYEVKVNPLVLSAAGFTLDDVVSTIEDNNNREPGGIAYLPNHETTIDVRGDITNTPSLANLLITAASLYTSTAGNASFGEPALPGSPGAPSASTMTGSSAASAPSAPAANSATSAGAASTSSNSAAPIATASPAPIATVSPQPVFSAVAGASANALATASPSASPIPYAATAANAATSIVAATTNQSPAPASAPAQSSGGAPSGGAYGGPALSTLYPWTATPRQMRIADVATVDDTFEPQREFSYVGTVPTISLSVQKATGASEVTSARSVVAALPGIEKRYPDINFQILNNQAAYTEDQIMGVVHTLGEAIMITALVMLFFLRSWRNAIVVLVAIPSSLCVTLAIMKIANFTIDTISLLAMTLIIGILVDDSIVVLENIERHYESGEDPKDSAIKGRTQIGPAAIVITLVDVVVFLPIAFLPGTIGRFLSEFGLVVVVATLTSLFVSFTVTPALAGNWSLLTNWQPPKIIDWFSIGFERLRQWYAMRALPWALKRPWLVVGGSGTAVVLALLMIPIGLIGFEFMPAVDRGEVFIQVTYPTGTPLAKVNETIAKLTQQLSMQKAVQSQTATAGATQSGFGGSLAIGSVGQVHVFLADDHSGTTYSWSQRFGRMATKLAPGAKIVSVAATGSGGGSSQQIDYLVTTTDDAPEKYAPELLTALTATPGAVDVNSSALNLAPQVDVEFNRDRARALGVNIGQAASAIRAGFGGTLASQIQTAHGIKYVQVIYPPRFQTSLKDISDIPLRTNANTLVHIGDIAYFVQDPSSPLMTRVNRQTVVHLQANLAPGVPLSIVQRRFLQRVAALHLPDTVSVLPNAGGNQQNLAETVKGMGASLVLSFFLVYLLMVALYNSYRLPFIIMFSVPVAAVGALTALALTHQALNLFSLIGTVLLVGLATKNGILLVDFANHMVENGMDRAAAMLEAARERFRPIVMTTCAMIAGMTPIALALDQGGASRQALGVVVIGGLISSLVLTLVLVPVIFMWLGPTPKGQAA